MLMIFRQGQQYFITMNFPGGGHGVQAACVSAGDTFPQQKI
jgi:hypothetical protein